MTRFSIKKNKIEIWTSNTLFGLECVLKFFPQYDPPNPPHHSPLGLSGEGGLLKVKKLVDFEIHFRLFQAFLDHIISIKGAGWVGPDP